MWEGVSCWIATTPDANFKTEETFLIFSGPLVVSGSRCVTWLQSPAEERAAGASGQRWTEGVTPTNKT